MIDVNAIGKGIRKKLDSVREYTDERVCGRIIYSGDGVVHISGLQDVKYNELLEIQGGYRALALNLERNMVGAVLFSGEDKVRYGDLAYSTGETVQMRVGEEMLGRIVDPLGQPLDGLAEIKTDKYRPVEFPAPAIMDRAKVNKPLQTGILAIDSMIPIGRGQRELIIGDRQTGKTAIAVDAILNQKGENVICIYVSIGQKASSLAKIITTLHNADAMKYTCVVCSTADDDAPLQYLAPYSGCALAEYFMYQGKDVLIVYDDLSKHAVAYRTMSLLLKRPAGREAYPGDVFYLHSRLLERAAKLSEEKGGGSITALPIVETLAGDISAYIPTNVISITDGQIYLESGLFFSGQRPAVNVGLSVSRVGGAAQTRAIKKTAGTLRIDLARFRELEVFTQFSSDLDAETRQALDHGKQMMALLRQPLCAPMSVARQAIILYIATSNLLADVPLEKVSGFAQDFVDLLEREQSALVQEINDTGALSGTATEQIRTTLQSYKEQVSATWKA